MSQRYTVIIPAYNEADAIGETLEKILAVAKERGDAFEVIVVDDCSTDATRDVVRQHPATLLENIQNFGYGYSIKRGIAHASAEHIIITDADGTYPIAELPKLLEVYERGFDMVVGARRGKHYRGSLFKYPARLVFLWLAEFAAGRKIPDINSGLRVFRKEQALRYLHTCSTGFSFTTTLTLAFLLNAHSVTWLPISYYARVGTSKIRYIRDTLRTAQVIVESILFYNPIKIYLLCGLVIAVAALVTVLLLPFVPALVLLTLFLGFSLSVVVFCIGLVAVYLKFVHSRR